MKAQAAEMDFREMQENLNKAGYKEKNVTISSKKATVFGGISVLPLVVIFAVIYRLALVERAHLTELSGPGFYITLVAIITISIVVHELLQPELIGVAVGQHRHAVLSRQLPVQRSILVFLPHAPEYYNRVHQHAYYQRQQAPGKQHCAVRRRQDANIVESYGDQSCGKNQHYAPESVQEPYPFAGFFASEYFPYKHQQGDHNDEMNAGAGVSNGHKVEKMQQHPKARIPYCQPYQIP